MSKNFLNKLKEELLNIDSDIYEEIYGDKISIDSNYDSKEVLSLYTHILDIKNSNKSLNKLILKKAADKDFDSTMKILLYSRDIKLGLGMREIFRDAIFYLACNYDKNLEKYINRIIKVGRFDDLYSFFDTKYESYVIEYFKNKLEEDRLSENPSNLCKWLKSINTSSKESRRLARKTADGLGLTYGEYRLLLSELRSRIKLTEQMITLNRWNEIEYKNVPKLAYKKYYKAFKSNDQVRLNDYIETNSLKKNKVIYKCEYISKLRDLLSEDNNIEYIESYKNTLLSGSDKNSGNWITASCINENDIKNETNYLLESISISLFFLLNNVGKFEKYFFKTNGVVNFKKINSDSLFNIIEDIIKSSICNSINISNILDLILFAAIKNNISDEQLPSGIILIVHDMSEIYNRKKDTNVCSNSEKVHFDLTNEKKKWDSANYTLPEIKICVLGKRRNKISLISENSDVSVIEGFGDEFFDFITNSSDENNNKISNEDIEKLEKILNDNRYN